MQRTQLEELIQSLSRSRDENVLADIEPALRVALQQTAITGSAEPLVPALKQADERLARYNQPRLEGVRRAIARDLDRVRAAGRVDIAALTIKLDEAMRLVDELPLLSTRAEARAGQARRAAQRRPAASRPPRACLASAVCGLARWRPTRLERGARRALGGARRALWAEVRGAGARDAHRPARGHAARARAGLLPAREPEAAAAQRAPGAAEPPVRHRAVRPARAPWRCSTATSTAAPQRTAQLRSSCCARWRRRRARSACRGPTTRWPRWPTAAGGR